MADSVYRVTEVIGVSADSWEAAARNAVETAAKSVRALRGAGVLRQEGAIPDAPGRSAPQLAGAPRHLFQIRQRRLKPPGGRSVALCPADMRSGRGRPR